MKFEQLATLYTGPQAASYDAARAATPQWRAEHAIVDGFLKSLPRGSTILDAPVGTGRFLELYRNHGLNATGVDISPDMLHLASEHAHALGLQVTLTPGDIRRLDVADSSFDASVCMRFLNWVDTKHVDAVLAEFSRVTRSQFVLSVKVYPSTGSLFRRGSNVVRGFWRKVKGAGMLTHDQRLLHSLFAKNSFRIADARLIDQDARGASYYIYVLRRDGQK